MPTIHASFAHEGTLASLLVPDDWEATEPAANQIRFFGPAHPEHDGYRPTFSILLGEPTGFGEEWFEDLCEQSVETLQATHAGFALRSRERFTLSSLIEVHATWFQWSSEQGLEFAQLQALAPIDARRMYLINAATLLPLAEEHLPIFDEVLHSLRYLPPR